jgi:hypothetical protein
MSANENHDPKNGNDGGSSVQETTNNGVRQPDAPNAGEGADPSEDIRKQNPGETTTADLAERTDADDPHLAEKLTKAGRPDFDPNESAD